MLNCSIERVNQAFLIRANDQLIPPYAYMTYQPARGRYQDFRKAGVRFVSVAVYSGDRGINPTSAIRPFRPGFMTCLLYTSGAFAQTHDVAEHPLPISVQPGRTQGGNALKPRILFRVAPEGIIHFQIIHPQIGTAHKGAIKHLCGQFGHMSGAHTAVDVYKRQTLPHARLYFMLHPFGSSKVSAV